jgi:uncharacterized protein (TIGR02466 family)
MIKIEQWFPTPILCDTAFDIDTTLLEKFCFKIKDLSLGRKATNYGGWQSEDLDISLPELKPLLDKIYKSAEIMHSQFGLKKEFRPVLDNLWININPIGGFNIPHVHGESIFSGVFYVKGTKDNGNIIFTHPAINIPYHLPEIIIDKFNLINSGSVFHHPQPGKLLMFPSWISHYVEPNLINEERISIAFNLKLEYVESV